MILIGVFSAMSFQMQANVLKEKLGNIHLVAQVKDDGSVLACPPGASSRKPHVHAGGTAGRGAASHVGAGTSFAYVCMARADRKAGKGRRAQQVEPAYRALGAQKAP